jgi:hypothetical protein
VTGKYFSFFRQYKHLIPYTAYKLFITSSRKIRPADPSGKKEVSGKQNPFPGVIIADVAR